MGSIMMHLCISEIYRKKHNLSDKFLVGSILPDIYKQTIMNKAKSHYLKNIEFNNKIRLLPDISKFMAENKKECKDEIIIGYLAHLLEDYVWFNNIINECVEECGKDENGRELYRYKNEDYKILHNSDHFIQNIYEDYNYLDKVLIEKIPIDIERIKEETKIFLNNDEKFVKVIDEQIIMHKAIENRENFFITEDIANIYIEMCLKVLEKYIDIFIS
ncbi:MAG: zinc dependent phospholipase C family protein [Clostridia bacterium]|nr:zinc dependent phospholipase C family protein [Clostridia bacterium]